MQLVICDDEPIVLKEIKRILEEYLGEREECVIDIFDNPDKLLSFAEKKSIDIAFVDIVLGKENGIDVAKKLLAKRPECQLVYFSGYMDYVLDAYETEHCYYVMKNQFNEHLPEIMGKIKKRLNRLYNKLIVSNGKGQFVIDTAEIRYIERQGRTTLVNTKKENIMATENLKSIQMRLNALEFVRCHNSYIVALQHVKRYERRGFLLDDGQVIPISRSYSSGVRETFLKWGRAQ